MCVRMCAGVGGCGQVWVGCGGLVWAGMGGCGQIWVGGCARVCEVCGINFQNFFQRIESLHQRTLIHILYEFFTSSSLFLVEKLSSIVTE